MKFDIRFYFSIFLRRLHYFLVVAILVSAAGVTVATMLPPVYRSDARLLVEGAQIPNNLAASTVQTGGSEQIQIIRQQLTTRDVLLELADEMKIYPNRLGMNPDAIVSDLRGRIRIDPNFGRGANTLVIGFSGSDPAKTTEVANELVTRVLEQNAEMRRGSATQTANFFEEEVQRLSEELDKKSAQILDFKMKHQNALPDGLDYRRSRQTAQQERLVQLQRDEANLKERREKLTDLYERTGRVEPVSENLSPAQKQLRDLQDQLDNALLVYSPQNPRIKVLKTKVEALKEEVSQESDSSDGEEAGPSMYDIQLADIDGQLENIERQKEQINTELESLQEAIDATPGNGIRLSELERAYQQTQSQYQAAVGRLNAAQTGERLEVMSKGQRITVLEQATVPRQPASPDRKLIAAASLGGGMALGLAVVLLLELLNSSIRRPVEITNRLGITPIATLPYMRTPREQRIRKGLITLAFLVVLVGIPGTIWALHTYYLPLDLLIERGMDKLGLAALIEQLQGGLGQ